MMGDVKAISILVADDDPDDRMLIKEAFAENRIINNVEFVEDGEQLLAYLRREGPYAHLAGQPYPGLVLLDLNMPKRDGREALADMKADAALRRIPVVVLTTSKAEEDIMRTYGLGVSSFITKPVTFEGLVEITRVLTRYWIEIVELPSQRNSSRQRNPNVH
jgi:CheY-like chemotaxis protein